MPQIHFGVLVMEDSILYNLPNIKRYILYDGIVEQGTLGCHFTHVRRRNKTRRDEVMPDLRYKGQMLGLEMDCMACTIDFPLTPTISQDPNNLETGKFHTRDWSEKLPFALWAYRTSFRTSIGATPYSLVHGMEVVLPIEIEMGSLRVALEQ